MMTVSPNEPCYVIVFYHNAYMATISKNNQIPIGPFFVSLVYITQI